MFAVNNAIKTYFGDVWNKSIAPLNVNPLKVNLSLSLNSEGKIPISYFFSSEVMDHLIINSLNAMSNIDEDGCEIMNYWNPYKPGCLSIRTQDYDGVITIDVEDDGCGINPHLLMQTDLQS
ncbi:MAG: hypothetical protein KKF89_03250, partial [Nanoarchaeota archaeon]|nr:hypothetical protein [Nanoarchaeota archaeon]MBU1854712.1 hypothetical protein [Nanoarchaeota archaeon]